MKKMFITALVAGLTAVLSSCGTTNGTAQKAAVLDGEWNIEEVSGKPIDKQKTENEAFIGFSQAKKQMYGCAGCNRIFSQFKADAKKHKLDLGVVGCTRMMCANMETEDAVLKVIDQVKKYDISADGTLTLKTADGKTLMVLSKREKKN